MTSPNSAFAYLCRNPDAYLGQSVTVFLVASVLGAVVVVPYEIFYGHAGESNWAPFLLNIMSVLVSGIVSVLVVHLAGCRLGGSQNWKQTFVTLFHVHVLLVVASAAIGVIWIAVSPLDMYYLMFGFGQDIGVVFAYYAVVVGFSAWIIVLSVKAIKVVHSFGTVKALGLLILSVAAAYAAAVPFEIGMSFAGS